MVAQCSSIPAQKLKTLYEEACVAAADGQGFTFADPDDEDDDSGLEAEPQAKPDCRTECEKFLTNVACNPEVDFLLNEQPATEEKEDELVDVPDTEILRDLLEKANVRDNACEINTALDVGFSWLFTACS